jgi:hypothetical protein
MEEFWRIFCGQGICAANSLTAKNRAFRSKSSEAPMRFLWAFRCNPLRSGSAKPLRDFAATYAHPGFFQLSNRLQE